MLPLYFVIFLLPYSKFKIIWIYVSLYITGLKTRVHLHYIYIYMSIHGSFHVTKRRFIRYIVLKKNHVCYHLCCKVSVLVSPVGITYKSMRKGWSCWAFFNDYVVPVQWHFKISAKKFYFFVDRYIRWYVDYPVKKSPRLVLVKNNKPVNVCSQTI